MTLGPYRQYRNKMQNTGCELYSNYSNANQQILTSASLPSLIALVREKTLNGFDSIKLSTRHMTFILYQPFNEKSSYLS